MFVSIENLVAVIIIALCALVVAAFLLIAYVCRTLVAMVQSRIQRIENSMTSQEQYLYYTRQDINYIDRDLTSFFRINGFSNLMAQRRRATPEQEIREAAPPAREPTE